MDEGERGVFTVFEFISQAANLTLLWIDVSESLESIENTQIIIYLIKLMFFELSDHEDSDVHITD